jgi:hypothetical protein
LNCSSDILYARHTATARDTHARTYKMNNLNISAINTTISTICWAFVGPRCCRIKSWPDVVSLDARPVDRLLIIRVHLSAISGTPVWFWGPMFAVLSGCRSLVKISFYLFPRMLSIVRLLYQEEISFAHLADCIISIPFFFLFFFCFFFFIFSSFSFFFFFFK